jgi:hypothetical protein
MPGFFVVTSATVNCLHQGKAQPGAPNVRVKAGGQPTVLMPTPWTVAGCALTGTNAPPCTTAQWMTGSTRVLSGGQPLLLQDSQSLCAPSGTKLLVMVTQTRAKGT